MLPIVPAVGPMFASNQTSSAVGTIGSMLVTAQATARAYGTPVALRFEQAYKTLEYNGQDRKWIVNREQSKTPYDALYQTLSSLRNFRPVPLDHQQIRMLIFAPEKSGSLITQAFQVPTGGFEPVPLPKDVWVAPGEALALGPAGMAQPNLWHTPLEGIPYNLLDNFFVVFNGSGELVRRDADQCKYRDPSQRWTVDHKPESYPAVDRTWTSAAYSAPALSVPQFAKSSLSVIVYDRTKWNALGTSTADPARRLDLLKAGVPVYINRHTGAVLEEKR
jgi:hypothetical protein